MFKYPTDLYAYSELLRKVQPVVVVETGSAEGGSAAWFADQGAEVISVDKWSPDERDPRVHWITGSSTAPATVEQVYGRVRGRRALVSLDSDHHAEHVLAEMQAYAPLVTEGSYLVVEDTAIDAYGIDADSYPDGGPGVAVEQFLETHKDFEPDRNCDRFMLGMNPGGWLRRIECGS